MCLHEYLWLDDEIPAETIDFVVMTEAESGSTIYTPGSFGCVHFEEKIIIEQAVYTIYNRLKTAVNQLLIKETGKSLGEHLENGKTIEEIKEMVKELD